MNQASMFFTAVVMLAGAGWYVMASNSPAPGAAPLMAPVLAEANAAAKPKLVARAAVPPKNKSGTLSGVIPSDLQAAD